MKNLLIKFLLLFEPTIEWFKESEARLYTVLTLISGSLFTGLLIVDINAYSSLPVFIYALSIVGTIIFGFISIALIITLIEIFVSSDTLGNFQDDYKKARNNYRQARIQAREEKATDNQDTVTDDLEYITNLSSKRIS